MLMMMMNDDDYISINKLEDLRDLVQHRSRKFKVLLKLT